MSGPHWLVVGQTGSGKSVALREWIIPAWVEPSRFKLRRPQRHVLVLDPLNGSWPGATLVTPDHDEWMAALQRSRNCVGVWDECGNDCEADPSLVRRLLPAATISRNWGMVIYFVGQRATQIRPSIRNNCANAMVFYQQAEADRDILARSYGPAMLGSGQLVTHECLIAQPMKDTVKTVYPLRSRRSI